MSPLTPHGRFCGFLLLKVVKSRAELSCGGFSPHLPPGLADKLWDLLMGFSMFWDYWTSPAVSWYPTGTVSLGTSGRTQCGAAFSQVPHRGDKDCSCSVNTPLEIAIPLRRSMKPFRRRLWVPGSSSDPARDLRSCILAVQPGAHLPQPRFLAVWEALPESTRDAQNRIWSLFHQVYGQTRLCAAPVLFIYTG